MVVELELNLIVFELSTIELQLVVYDNWFHILKTNFNLWATSKP